MLMNTLHAIHKCRIREKKLLPGKIHFKPMYVEKGSLMFVFTIKSANLQC